MAVPPSGVAIWKLSVGTFLTMSAKILKLAAPRGMAMCEASEGGLAGAVCGGQGGIEVGLAGLVQQADDPVVRRGAVLEGFSGGDELAVDEVVKLFHGEQRWWRFKPGPGLAGRRGRRLRPARPNRRRRRCRRCAHRPRRWAARRRTAP